MKCVNSRRICNYSRVQYFDVMKTLEVTGVERQDLRQPVALHCGHKASVVGVFSEHLVLYDELLPRFKDGSLISKETHALHKPCNVSFGLRCGHPQPILFDRPCGHDPILIEHLGHETQRFVGKSKIRYGRYSQRVKRVTRLCSTKNNVGIDENHSPRPS